MWILWTLLGLIFLTAVACFVIGFIIWKKAIPKEDPTKYQNEASDDPVSTSMNENMKKESQRLKQMKMEEIDIRGFDGLNLHGYFKEAPIKTNKTIISVHGYRGTGLNTSPLFSGFLTDFNYNMLFIDLRSYGKTDFKYVTYGVFDTKDVLSWVNYLIDRYNQDAQIALFGISMGGHTVANCADKIPQQVKCIIDDCGYTSPWEEFTHILKDDMHLPTFFIYFAEIINRVVAGFSFKQSNALDAVKGARCPMLFTHGKDDKFVPTEMGIRIYEACTSEKQLKLFDDTRHAECYFLNRDEYKRLVLNFLARYL